MFGLEDVEPFPVPKSPAMMQHTPSVKIPLKITDQPCTSTRDRQEKNPPTHLLMAWTGGVAAPDRRAQA